MNTGLRITAFTAALAAAFGAAYGVGKGVDPLVTEAAPAPHEEAHRPPAGGRDGGPSGPGGLRIAENGYRLDLETPRVTAGERADLRFTVRDGSGRAVTAYRREHGRELHLIVASRDLGTYRHLHPARAADGTWSIPVDLPRAGDYRVFADFTPARKGAGNLTLGADLAAAGPYAPKPLPAPHRTARTAGYDVELSGTLRPGTPSDIRLKVSRDGRPVRNLQPYLGAYGHLVALRSGDLAHLHVHPHGEPGDGRTGSGPAVSFTVTAPTTGDYRLFLDFRHEGRVHTAAFTATADDGDKAPAGSRTGAGPADPHARTTDGHSH